MARRKKRATKKKRRVSRRKKANKCAATTNAGKPCKKDKVGKSKYCEVHKR